MASMKILVAEDEDSIAKLYQITLQSRGHEVTITSNGLECWKEYQSRSAPKDPQPPFDAVILDYRMPEMNGFETAKKILKLQPKQRIIFASAFMKQTLVDAINKFGIVAELLYKPFEIDRLVDAVEDTYIYSQLQSLSINVGDIRSWNPSHEQLSDLLDALLRLKDPRTVLPDLFSNPSAMQGSSTRAKLDHSGSSMIGQDPVQRNTGHRAGSDNSNAAAIAIVEEALRFLGSERLGILYYLLSKNGISKEGIVQNPSRFLSALDKMFGGGSAIIRAKILQVIEQNREAIDNLEAVAKFSKTLRREIERSGGN
jgi:CheY-like chemotaxis protein